MDEQKCYILDAGPSLRNLPLFSTILVFPLLILQVIIGLLLYDLTIELAAIYLAVVFIVEWLFRNLVLKQRPGYICIHNDKLTLWYFSGFLKIIYYSNRFKLLPGKNKEYLRIEIKGRILPLSVHEDKYYQIYEGINIFNLIKLVKK